MRKAIITAALLAVPLGGWYAVDQAQDARYERRCVKHASDIPLCDTGYAAKYRKRCDRGEQPAGTPPMSIADCVKAWLAQEQ